MSTCPHCNAELSEAERSAGRCPHCFVTFQVQNAGSFDQTIDSAEFLPGAVAGPEEELPPHKAPTVEDIAQTIDSAEFAPGGEVTRLDNTIDSAEFQATGTSAADMQQLEQTIDSAEFASGPPVAGRESDERSPTDSHGNLDHTIDSTELSASGKPSTVPDPRLTATLDSSDLASDVVARMIRSWSSASPDASPRMTIKGAAADTEPQNPTLVIQQRAFRDPVRDTERPVADYDLLDLIGEGGMGVVYSARQASIDRTVAVKMLKPQMLKDELLRRKFLSEAAVTGELDHPNIVPIYDLGQNEAGALFYSMKKVQGTPWIKVIRKKSLHENLEILLKVSDAIAFAHSRGVIHRDLKPENVMLGEFGEVLVLDWGLAVSTADRPASANIARIVTMGGTPAYMAPEMAAGPLEGIGRHSDVYVLGAILYECVTGKPPHTGKHMMRCLVAAAKNEIQPTKKSGELVDIAMKAMATNPQDRFESVQAFQQAIRDYQSHSESIALSTRAAEDLEAARKYDDYNKFAKALFGFEEAHELWEGNARALAGITEARLAYAASALSKGDFDLGLSLLDADNPEHLELHGKLTAAQHERDARHRRLKTAKQIMAGLAAMVFLAVTAGIVLVQIQKAEAVRQKQLADKSAEEAAYQRDQAEKSEKKALGLKDVAERKKEEALQSKRAADESARIASERAVEAKQAQELAEREAYFALIGAAAAKIDERGFHEASRLLDLCQDDFRKNWEWRRLRYLCQDQIEPIRVGERVDVASFNADATRVVTGSREGVARVWDVTRTEQPIGELPAVGYFVAAAAFSPADDHWVAVGTNDPQRWLQLWNIETGEQRILPGHTDAVVSVAFSRDGKQLLTSSYDHNAMLWDVATGTAVRTFRGHSWIVWSAAFSPDERRVVTASEDGTARIWDVESGEQMRSPETDQVVPFTGHNERAVYSAAFSPDGQYVVSGGVDNRVLIWRPDELIPFDFKKLLANEEVPRQPYQELLGHTSAISKVQFSPDGNWILSASHDNSIRIWYARDQETRYMRVKAGTLLKVLQGHDSLVRSASFSPVDPDQIVSASFDGTVRLWSVRHYQPQRVIPGIVFQGHLDAVLSARFSSDGRLVVTASRDRTAKTWDVGTGEEERTFHEGHAYLASMVVPIEGGNGLVTSARDNSVRIWSVETGSQRLEIAGTGVTAAMAASPDGHWVLTGSDDQHDVTGKSVGNEHVARLWDLQKNGGLARTFGGHAATVTAVALSHDANLAFTGDQSGQGFLWETHSGRQLATLDFHLKRITAAAFTADGKRLLTASRDNTVCPWNLEDLTNVWRMETLKHPAGVSSLAVVADGRQVVTGCEDGAARLWNVDRAEPQWMLEMLEQGNVSAVAASDDGKQALAVDSENDVVRLLDVETGKEVVPDGLAGQFLSLSEHDALASSAAFLPDGRGVITIGGNEARMWDMQGRERMSFSPHRTVTFASFSPDGRRIATAGWDNSARIWDAATASAVLKLAAPVAGEEGAHTKSVSSAVFSADGSVLLTASDDGTAKLWDVTTGKVLGTFKGHEAGVLSAEFSSDGRRIVTASSDRTARIWDVATRQSVGPPLRGHDLPVTHAAFSPNDQWIVTGSEDNNAKVWDAETGEEVRTLSGHTAAVNAVTFSPDGSRILTGAADSTAKLWDAADGREILALKGHQRAVTSVSFSRDGHYALTASSDGTAIVWLAADDPTAATAAE